MARICKNEKGWNWNIGTCDRDRESSINLSFTTEHCKNTIPNKQAFTMPCVVVKRSIKLLPFYTRKVEMN